MSTLGTTVSTTDIATTADLSTHEADTTSVHGIANTANLLTSATKLDDLAAPDDNTDLNATTGVHGLLPKLGGGSTNFLRADGTWNAPAGGGGAPTDAQYLVGAAHGDLSAEIVVTAAGLALLDDAAASDQRTTLGLGTMATQAASAVAISGGSVVGITDLAVADGGTGSGTAAGARTNLGLPDIPWNLVTKGSDESLNTSTTVQSDDELLFATTAGGLYEFECMLIYASPVGAGTPDIKIGGGEDTTIRGIMTTTGWATTDAVNTGSGGAIRTGTAALTAGTAAANRMARIYGTFLAVGGTFVMQWAQNVSDANDVTVRAGSILRWRRIL